MIQLGLAMIILTVMLFIIAFVSKRRFGLLGLSLAAGSVLSGLWAQYSGEVMNFFDMARSSSTEATIGVMLILLPAAITLFHGYTYKTLVGRFFGALAFAILAVALLADPLGYAFVNTDPMSDLVAQFVEHKDLLVAVGIICAVFDLLLSKPRLLSKKR